LAHPLTRGALLLFCVLPLFHWAHRFRYTLYDGLQIKHLNELVNLFCYGGALIGSAVAVYVIWVALVIDGTSIDVCSDDLATEDRHGKRQGVRQAKAPPQARPEVIRGAPLPW
jgi:hypothetical protein